MVTMRLCGIDRIKRGHLLCNIHELFIILPPFSVLLISFFVGCIIWDNQAGQNIHDLCMCMTDIYKGADLGIYGGLHGQVSFVISSFVHVASGHVRIMYYSVRESRIEQDYTKCISSACSESKW